MKTVIDVEPTAEIIDNIAKRMAEYSEDMKRVAVKMREQGDITYASEAINIVSNSINSFRLDLLVTRPIRELDAIIRTMRTGSGDGGR